MLLACIGLLAVLLFGFQAGYSPLSKWPWAERAAACLAALLLIVAVLLWKQHSQGACLPPQDQNPHTDSFVQVCQQIFTLKSVVMAYASFLLGLVSGLLYRSIGTAVTKRQLRS
jgi:hypothetical protein